MSGRSNPIFQMLILRECNSEPTLRKQIRTAEAIERIGKLLAVPSAIVLDNLTRYLSGGSVTLPGELTRDAVVALTGKANVLGCAQVLMQQVARVSSPDKAYRMCWQSALCYGMIGWHDHAYRALDGAYLFEPTWKRHHHALGLVHGIDKNFELSIDNLNTAYTYEPEEAIRGRVGEGLSIASCLRRNPHSA